MNDVHKSEFAQTGQNSSPLPKVDVFIDSNNLFHAAKNAFGEGKYSINRLVDLLCKKKGWQLGVINYYSGVPKKDYDPVGYVAVMNRLDQLRRRGVNVVPRDLQYRTKKVCGPDGEQTIVTNVTEKGIDVRLALDAVRSAYEKSCDAFLILSQDQDLSEICLDIERICKQQSRTVEICSAYPFGPTYANTRGLRGSNWIHIDEAMYQESKGSPRRDVRRTPEATSNVTLIVNPTIDTSTPPLPNTPIPTPAQAVQAAESAKKLIDATPLQTDAPRRRRRR